MELTCSFDSTVHQSTYWSHHRLSRLVHRTLLLPRSPRTRSFHRKPDDSPRNSFAQLGPQPAPPIEDHVAEYVERKFRRWTFGRWNPPRGSIAFKTFALDYIGMALLLGTVTCLVLALQWGGEKYSWSSPTIGGIFGCFTALVLLFVGWEWKLAGPTSILPLGLFKSRTQVGATMSAFFCMFCLMLGTVR